MAHTFEFEGMTVEYRPAIVKTWQKRGRIVSKLMLAYGYVIEDPKDEETIIPDTEWDDITEYAEFMSQSCAKGAAWWADENATPDALRAAYEAFSNSDPSIVRLFRQAHKAVSPPKKTSLSNSGT